MIFDDLKGKPTAAKWETLLNRLNARLRFRGGPGIRVNSLGVETLISATRRGVRAVAQDSSGPFCMLFTDDGNRMLLGGIVSGGTGNITVPDINMGAVDTPPADGTYYWLNISFTATKEDDVLLPGGVVTAASVASGTSLPSNTIPTAASPAASLKVSLGVWSQGKFVPSGCGNFQIGHCPGGITYTPRGFEVYGYGY